MVSGPGLWTTFLYYFAMMMLIGSFTASRAMHSSLMSPATIQIGVLLGAIAGIGGTYFNRSVTWEFEIEGQKVFANRLEQALQSLNYELAENKSLERPAKVYARSGAGAAFAGRLYVITQDNTVQLVGRSSTIRRLKEIL